MYVIDKNTNPLRVFKFPNPKTEWNMEMFKVKCDTFSAFLSKGEVYSRKCFHVKQTIKVL